jgi:thiamine kinase-like enzyme
MFLPIRRPAHTSLQPSKIQWDTPSNEEKDLIQNFFIEDINQIIKKKVDKHNRYLSGYYDLKTKSRKFIKILLEKEFNSKSINLEHWLFKNSANVITEKSTHIIITKNERYIMLTYDFIETKEITDHPSQMHQLGYELGKLHNCLLNYPDKNTIKLKSEQRNHLLTKQLIKAKEGEKKTAIINHEASSIIQSVEINNLSLLYHEAQVIHGDLNYGNILLSKDNEIIFIDFEDATHTWLNPLYDVAFVLQRFILTAHRVNRKELVNNLISGYKISNNKVFLNKGSDTLLKIYKTIAIRSILILSLLPQKRQIHFEDEYLKFNKLYKTTPSEEKLLRYAYEKLQE